MKLFENNDLSFYSLYNLFKFNKFELKMPNGNQTKSMDQEAKKRIMKAGATNNGGETQKDSWEARAQVCA